MIVEDVDALVVIDAESSSSPHDGTTQVSVSFHIGQQKHCKEEKTSTITDSVFISDKQNGIIAIINMENYLFKNAHI